MTVAYVTPADLAAYVSGFFQTDTCSRCYRSSVWGLTTNEHHRARWRALLIAAMNSLSRRRRRGRPAMRLRTSSWWRRTISSTSLFRSSEGRRAAGPRGAAADTGGRRARTEPPTRKGADPTKALATATIRSTCALQASRLSGGTVMTASWPVLAVIDAPRDRALSSVVHGP